MKFITFLLPVSLVLALSSNSSGAANQVASPIDTDDSSWLLYQEAREAQMAVDACSKVNVASGGTRKLLDHILKNFPEIYQKGKILAAAGYSSQMVIDKEPSLQKARRKWENLDPHSAQAHCRTIEAGFYFAAKICLGFTRLHLEVDKTNTFDDETRYDLLARLKGRSLPSTFDESSPEEAPRFTTDQLLVNRYLLSLVAQDAVEQCIATSSAGELVKVHAAILQADPAGLAKGEEYLLNGKTGLTMEAVNEERREDNEEFEKMSDSEKEEHCRAQAGRLSSNPMLKSDR